MIIKNENYQLSCVANITKSFIMSLIINDIINI